MRRFDAELTGIDDLLHIDGFGTAMIRENTRVVAIRNHSEDFVRRPTEALSSARELQASSFR
jgi:hypothetical protein